MSVSTFACRLDRRSLADAGWGTSIEAHVDEGLGGKNTNRPAFKRLMRDIEHGRIDAVMLTETTVTLSA